MSISAENVKLSWDATGARLYETGVSNGVLYPYNSTADPEKGEHAYGPGVAWNGLTAYTESPEGAESNPIYADNIKYLNLRSAEDFGFTLEAYTYPDEFAECNGELQVVPGLFAHAQPRTTFGFSCRTIEGNDTKLDQYAEKIHLVYGCTAAPSERAYQTVNDSPEAITFSWEIDTVPESIGSYGKPTAQLTIDLGLIKRMTNATAKAKALAGVKTLEEALYGTAQKDPYLPLPSEVIKMFEDAVPPTP